MKTRISLVLAAAVCMIPTAGFAADKPGAKYTATGVLRISRQMPFILFPPAHQDSEKEFDTYKRTQRELVMSRFVMLAALRKPDVARLIDVQTVQHVADVVRWLQSLVKVEFPGDAEIMTVSVTTGDPNESAALARGVIDAYLKDIVEAERDQKRMRLNELDRACVEKETEIRRKREDLKKLAETLGVSDGETLSVKQKLALETLSIYRQETAKTRSEVKQLRAKLATMKAALQGDKEAGPNVAPNIRDEIKRLETSIAVAAGQLSEMEQNVERQQREAERFGTSTVDIEMMRADIKIAEAVWNEISMGRERLRVEIHAVPRITAPFGRAEVPENKD